MTEKLIKPQGNLNNWLLGASVALSLFVFLFHEIFMPFLVAFFFAYLLTPFVNNLTKSKLSRPISASIIMLGFLCLIVGALFFLIPYVTGELIALTRQIPGHWEALKNHLLLPHLDILGSIVDEQTMLRIQNTLTENFGKILGWTLSLFTGFFSSMMVIANLVSLLLITPLVTFYLLLDWPRIETFFQGLVPMKHKEPIDSLFADIKKTLHGFLKGQVTVCLVLAAYYIICLKLLGLQYAVTIGLLTGLLAFIPYLGFLLGFSTALGVAIFQFNDMPTTLLVVGIYGVAQIMESFFLTPKLVGHRIGLHPVWVIFVLLAGGVAAGFTGVLLAIPVAAVFAVILRRILKTYREYFTQEKPLKLPASGADKSQKTSKKGLKNKR